MFQLSKFNMLISLVLQGNKNWEWAPVLLARVSLGLFFAISGAQNLLPEASTNKTAAAFHEECRTGFKGV